MSPDDLAGAPPKAKEILAYFLRNPQAADSLEGIARWRVQEEAAHQIVDEVDRALGWLVDRNLLVRETAPGITPVFRLGPRRTVEVGR